MSERYFYSDERGCHEASRRDELNVLHSHVRLYFLSGLIDVVPRDRVFPTAQESEAYYLIRLNEMSNELQGKIFALHAERETLTKRIEVARGQR